MTDTDTDRSADDSLASSVARLDAALDRLEKALANRESRQQSLLDAVDRQTEADAAEIASRVDKAIKTLEDVLKA
ncbi:MAG: hypothetical protein AAGG65_17975 [Pseudomonadota bacterium]